VLTRIQCLVSGYSSLLLWLDKNAVSGAERLLKVGCCIDLNACPVKLCCQYDMALCCSTCPVMPDQTGSATITLKLLIFCCSLADIDLTASQSDYSPPATCSCNSDSGPCQLENEDSDKM